MAKSRRQFLVGSAALAVGTALNRSLVMAVTQQPAPPPGGRAAQPPAPVVPVFTPIRRNVGYFTGRGGTIGYLASPDAVVVVDSQFPDSAQLFVAGLKERGSARPVDLLINTHHHGDHTAGNIVFKGSARKVVSHARAAELMKQPPGRPANTADQLYPDTTFTDTWTETVGDEVMRAKFYGPAHTSGDAVITFERANVVHMGDLMFNRRAPVVDRPAGASLKNWTSVIERAAADHSADTVYIFGHAGMGAPVTGGRPELMTMRDYLTAVIAFVEAERKAGRTREQITTITTPLPRFEGHGPLTSAVLTAAYEELGGA